ncbi:MAG: GNAT family N-acetyltransferase [Planctomycetota bacterium]|nr:MAG: GNAT family N-acetyltransferase [Planctomycetota bacterium]
MNERVLIRPARADDYDAIVRCWEESGLSVRLRGRDARDAFLAQLEAFPTLYLVAEEAGRIVGTILGTHDRRKGWINRLAVIPSHRRRRIAARLVAACEEALRAEGIGIVSALVETDNHASAALFRRLDYRTDVEVIYFRKLFRPEV